MRYPIWMSTPKSSTPDTSITIDAEMLAPESPASSEASDASTASKAAPSKLIENRVRRTKFRASNRAEHRLRDGAVKFARMGKGRKSRSEKSRSKWRNDLGRDENIFKCINNLLRNKQPIKLTTRSAYSVTSARAHLRTSKTSGLPTIPKVGLPHWDHASPRLKMLGWGMASWTLNARPFSLRLGEEVMEAAAKDKRGFARHIQDRITRLLKYHVGEAPCFWFSVEMGALEMPHLHGAVVIPHGMEEQAKKALKTAAGEWSSEARQLQFSRKRNAVNWVGYCTKWLYGTKARIRGTSTVGTGLGGYETNTTGATQSMRRAAKDWYQKARQTETVIYPV